MLQGYLGGGVILLLSFVAILVNVRITGWRQPLPVGHVAKEVADDAATFVRVMPGRLIGSVVVALLVALVVICTVMYAVLPVTITMAILGTFVLLFAILSNASFPVQLLVAAGAILCMAVFVLWPGEFSVQLLIIGFMCAYSGVYPAGVPQLVNMLGDGVGRIWLSIPIWLCAGVVAPLLDVFGGVSPRNEYAAALELKLVTASGSADGDIAKGLLDIVLYGQQKYGIGFFTPGMLVIFTGILTVWARYYNERTLIMWPLVGYMSGGALGLLITIATGTQGNAAAWTYLGVALGTLGAVWRTGLWRQLMQNGQPGVYTSL